MGKFQHYYYCPGPREREREGLSIKTALKCRLFISTWEHRIANYSELFHMENSRIIRYFSLTGGHFYFVPIPVHMTTTNAALRVIKSTTTEQVAVTCTNDESPPHIILDCPVLACYSKTARRWLSRPCCRYQTQLAWQQRSRTSSPFLSPFIPFP